MAIKTIDYTVDISGITPSTELFCGTNGDHRAVSLKFTLSENLKNALLKQDSSESVVYRFEIYNTDGYKYISDTANITSGNIEFELEEKHTRYGGKITVYLVISVLSPENETNLELYSFPALLRFKNRPYATENTDENYESLSSIAEVAKTNASKAELSADISKEQAALSVSAAADAVKTLNSRIPKPQIFDASNPQAVMLKINAETDSENIPADTEFELKAIDDGTIPKYAVKQAGKSISTRDVNGNLWTDVPIDEEDCANKKYVDNYHDATKQNKLKAGDNITIEGDVIKTTVDQTYNPSSENAQSGTAVSSAIAQGTESLHRAVGNLQGDVSALENIKQNKLTAGDNITIDENNVISATGGGTSERFELIADVTTSETVDTIKITTDAYNNPLDLKEVFAECITASGTAGQVQFVTHNSSTYSVIGYAAAININASNKTVSALWVKALGNKNFISLSNDLGTLSTEYFYTSGTKNQTITVHKETGDDSIKQILLAKYTASIPAGTRLKIWGVKA